MVKLNWPKSSWHIRVFYQSEHMSFLKSNMPQKNTDILVLPWVFMREYTVNINNPYFWFGTSCAPLGGTVALTAKLNHKNARIEISTREFHSDLTNYPLLNFQTRFIINRNRDNLSLTLQLLSLEFEIAIFISVGLFLPW